MPNSKLEVHIDATGHGSVKLDSQEIKMVAGVHIDSSVDDVTRVTLDLIAVDIDATFENAEVIE